MRLLGERNTTRNSRGMDRTGIDYRRSEYDEIMQMGLQTWYKQFMLGGCNL